MIGIKTRQKPVWQTVIVSAICLTIAYGCGSRSPEEHIERARGYYDSRELEAVVIELKNALRQDPNLVDARWMLGRTYQELGEPIAAIAQLQQALDLGFDEALVKPVILKAKLADDRHEEVLDALRNSMLTPELRAIKGVALLEADDTVSASAEFDAALAADDVLAYAYYGDARLAESQGDEVRARQRFERAVKLAPLERAFWLDKAEFELRRNDSGSAIISFENALALPGLEVLPRVGLARAYIASGDNVEAKSQLAEVMARTQDFYPAHYLYGLIAVLENQDKAAEDSLLQVERADPSFANTRYLMAIVKFRLGQLAQAGERLRTYVARNPQSTPGRKLLALVNIAQDDLDAAREILQPLAAITDDAQYVAMMGSICLRLGDYDCALANLGRAVQLEPDAASFRQELALSLIGVGDDEQAVGTLETAVAIDAATFEPHYLLILVHIKDREFQRALDAAQALVERAPRDPMAYNFLGAAHIGLKQWDEAIAAFEASVGIEETFTPAVVNLARVHQQLGAPELAIAQFEALLERAPDNLTALTGLASLAASSGKLAEAARWLNKAVLAHPQQVAPRLSLARIARSQGDMTGALEATAGALEVEPNNVNVLLAHAELLLGTSQVDAARDYITRADARVGSDIDVEMLTRIGAMLKQVGEPTRALARFRDALARQPDNVPSLIAMVRVDTAEGRLNVAERNLAKLKQLGVDESLLALLQGDVAIKAARTSDALDHYRVAAAAGMADAILRIAALHGARGDGDAARGELESWLVVNPGSVPVRLALGGVLTSLGESAGAVELYESLHNDFPGNPVVMNNLAWLYWVQGDDRAFALAERAYEIAPENAAVADTYGWLLLQSNRTSEALDVLKRSVGLNPSRPVFHYHLAEAHASAGNQWDARRAVDKALSLGDFPEREAAEKLLRSLN